VTDSREPLIKRPNIGLKRIGKNVPQDIADNTRAVRAAMDDILWNMRQVVKGLTGVTPDALEYGLWPIFAESQRLVPVDTGALHDSGYLNTGWEGNRAVAEIGYAPGGIPDYAVKVHEDLEARHKPPTKAKFLQDAIDTELDGVQERILEYLRKAVPL
jgi:hypothetical protein